MCRINELLTASRKSLRVAGDCNSIFVIECLLSGCLVTLIVYLPRPSRPYFNLLFPLRLILIIPSIVGEVQVKIRMKTVIRVLCGENYGWHMESGKVNPRCASNFNPFFEVRAANDIIAGSLLVL